MEKVLKTISASCGKDNQESMRIMDIDSIHDEWIKCLEPIVEDLPQGKITFDRMIFKAKGPNYKALQLTNGKIKYKIKIKLLNERFGGGKFIEKKITHKGKLRKWSIKCLYSYAYIVISGRTE